MNILVFAPHADDEILGVGGTMAKHINQGDTVYVCVVTRPYPPVYNDEQAFITIRQETNEAHKLLGIEKTFFLELPTVMLETVPRYELNSKIKAVVDEVKADIIYLPHFGDMQKDHAIVAEAVMVAVRPQKGYKPKAVYGYETLSETEWNAPTVGNAFIPNMYVDIADTLDIKICAMKCFKSQLSDFPNPRSVETIEALAKYRGSTIQSEAAEAFMLLRGIVS